MSDQELQKGKLVSIVGPSGSGKDTVIDWLRQNSSEEDNLMFVRRTVTRAVDEKSEDHASMSVPEFEKMDARGGFAVTWHAHGLRYGIPYSALAHVNNGGIAIANGSRRALPQIAKVFPRMLVVQLKVDRKTLAKRLADRGRENAEEIERRLERMDMPIQGQFNVASIDNSYSIESAGKAIRDLIWDNRCSQARSAS